MPNQDLPSRKTLYKKRERPFRLFSSCSHRTFKQTKRSHSRSEVDEDVAIDEPGHVGPIEEHEPSNDMTDDWDSLQAIDDDPRCSKDAIHTAVQIGVPVSDSNWLKSILPILQNAYHDAPLFQDIVTQLSSRAMIAHVKLPDHRSDYCYLVQIQSGHYAGVFENCVVVVLQLMTFGSTKVSCSLHGRVRGDHDSIRSYKCTHVPHILEYGKNHLPVEFDAWYTRSMATHRTQNDVEDDDYDDHEDDDEPYLGEVSGQSVCIPLPIWAEAIGGRTLASHEFPVNIDCKDKIYGVRQCQSVCTPRIMYHAVRLRTTTHKVLEINLLWDALEWLGGRGTLYAFFQATRRKYQRDNSQLCFMNNSTAYSLFRTGIEAMIYGSTSMNLSSISNSPSNQDAPWVRGMRCPLCGDRPWCIIVDGVTVTCGRDVVPRRVAERRRRQQRESASLPASWPVLLSRSDSRTACSWLDVMGLWQRQDGQCVHEKPHFDHLSGPGRELWDLLPCKQMQCKQQPGWSCWTIILRLARIIYSPECCYQLLDIHDCDMTREPQWPRIVLQALRSADSLCDKCYCPGHVRLVIESALNHLRSLYVSWLHQIRSNGTIGSFDPTGDDIGPRDPRQLGEAVPLAQTMVWPLFPMHHDGPGDCRKSYQLGGGEVVVSSLDIACTVLHATSSFFPHQSRWRR